MTNGENFNGKVGVSGEWEHPTTGKVHSQSIRHNRHDSWISKKKKVKYQDLEGIE